jgi:putative transcriptional regulator
MGPGARYSFPTRAKLLCFVEQCQVGLTGPYCQASLSAVENDVRALRTERGLSQGALAHELAVSRQTVNSIETGRYVPSLPLAIAIARFFGRRVEEVFHTNEDH